MSACGEENAKRGTARAANSSFSTPAYLTAIGTGKSPRTTPRRRPDDVCIRITASQRRAGAPPSSTSCRRSGSATAGPGRTASPKPVDPRRAQARRARRSIAEDEKLGAWKLAAGPDPDRPSARAAVLRQRDQRPALFGGAAADALSEGRHQRPRRQWRGDGQSRTARDEDGLLAPRHGRGGRDRRAPAAPGARHSGADARSRRRLRANARRPQREADEYYAALRPEGRDRRRSDGDAASLRGNGLEPAILPLRRRALARWRQGAAASARERKSGRNAGWRHLSNHHIVAMPDKWEYPWYASWDLAFHCVVLAHTDPAMAKNQLLLLAANGTCIRTASCRPTNGTSAMSIRRSRHGPRWRCSDRRRHGFRLPRTRLQQAADQLHLVGQPRGRAGDNIFEGGFLGLDNIGPFDRSAMLPGEVLEQSDGTAWMAKFCLNMLEMALLLANRDQLTRMSRSSSSSTSR